MLSGLITLYRPWWRTSSAHGWKSQPRFNQFCSLWGAAAAIISSSFRHSDAKNDGWVIAAAGLTASAAALVAHRQRREKDVMFIVDAGSGHSTLKRYSRVVHNDAVKLATKKPGDRLPILDKALSGDADDFLTQLSNALARTCIFLWEGNMMVCSFV